MMVSSVKCHHQSQACGEPTAPSSVHCPSSTSSLHGLLCECICVCVLSHFSRVWLFATLWTITHQAPLSMGFSKHEYWSGLLCSPPGVLPDLGIEPASLMSPALAVVFFTTSTTWEVLSVQWQAIYKSNQLGQKHHETLVWDVNEVSLKREKVIWASDPTIETRVGAGREGTRN